MPAIEEIPDDPPPPPPPLDMTPALPPALASLKSQSTADFLTSLSSLPLFSTSTSELDPTQLEALTALAYDSPPLETALNFQLQGNDSFRASRPRDALQFYTQALTVPHLPPSAPIRIALLTNRAAANLQLKNFGAVLRDCGAAMALDEHNVKAHYRAAQALAELARWPESVEIARRGTAIDPSNAPLLALLARAERGLAAATLKSATEARAAEETRLRDLHLRLALRKRGVVTARSGEKRPELEGHKVHLDAAEGKLVFPVIVLYPEAAQSDFVPAWRETETAAARLGGEVLAVTPPWDGKGEYIWGKVDLFMETVGGGLVKVGKKVPLGEVLGGGGTGEGKTGGGAKVQVVDDLVKLMVVPRGRVQGWVEEWKRRRVKS